MSAIPSPQMPTDSKKFGFLDEWRSRGPFDKVVALATFLALLFSIYPLLDLLFHRNSISDLIFAAQNAGLILVLGAQVAIVYRDKQLLLKQRAGIEQAHSREQEKLAQKLSKAN